ncbi:hypothetical protein ACFQZU_10690, partial [Streptomonospora algeriensis]
MAADGTGRPAEGGSGRTGKDAAAPSGAEFWSDPCAGGPVVLRDEVRISVEHTALALSTPVSALRLRQ